VQHILSNITDDFVAFAEGAPIDLPGIGRVIVHPYFMGMMGDLVGQRDVFCVKKNACALCVRVSDDKPSVMRTAAHRASVLEDGTADKWGYLDWVKADDVSQERELSSMPFTPFATSGYQVELPEIHILRVHVAR
jgi:hypothetical protein